MKTIGLIGGTTWHSTLDYYKMINEGIATRFGGYASARIIINSLNFQTLYDWNKNNDWKSIEKYLCNIAQDLEKAGAQCLLLGANTLHKVAEQIDQKINIPLIHIAKETAKTLQQLKINHVGLLGTKITMQSGFYQNILAKFGIQTIIPEEEDMNTIHKSILDEFAVGIFTNKMKKKYLKIIEKLQKQNIQGVILGCTEIPILIKPEDTDLALLNTTEIHVKAAIDFATS